MPLPRYYRTVNFWYCQTKCIIFHFLYSVSIFLFTSLFWTPTFKLHKCSSPPPLSQRRDTCAFVHCRLCSREVCLFPQRLPTSTVSTQTLEVGMETTRGVCPSQWRQVSFPPVVCRTARRQCCHTPGWLHQSGRCGVCGVVRSINKTFCTMSMNKFDFLLLCCTFLTIFSYLSIQALMLGFDCETCWIFPFGTDL